MLFSLDFTMVNFFSTTVVKFLVLAGVTTAVFAQTDADRERRLAELEKKIGLLDPSFRPTDAADFDQRLAAAEQKIEQLLTRNKRYRLPVHPRM